MIHLLPQSVIHQIAAGEVVERPSSIVKELVENSIDAGSTSIRVEIENGGKDFIRIIDTGSGMAEADLLLSVHPHATSKLDTIEDLESLMSFGFRGEALASIAAVSRLVIQSRHTDSSDAFELRKENEVYKTFPCAHEQGTTIEVSDLFYTVPARRKFLKSDAVEQKAIVEYLMVQVLLFPQIDFTLISNGKSVIKVSQVANLKERLLELFGLQFCDSLVPVFYDGDGLKIEGFVSKPQESVDKHPIQHTLVNKRVITDKNIASGVYSGYEGLLMTGQKPQYILNIEIVPHMVDCNIHPRKMEVRFADPSSIFVKVKSAVRHALDSANLRPQMKSEVWSLKSESHEIGTQNSGFRINHDRQTINDQRQTFSSNPYSQTALNYSHSSSSEMFSSLVDGNLELNHDGNLGTDGEFSVSTMIVGQLHRSYILVQQDRGLLIIDQHAAHERINYEKLKKQLEDSEIPSQRLLIPIQLELSVSDFEMFLQVQPLLQKLGFEVEEFGGRNVSISAIPEALDLGKAESIFLELLKGQHEDQSKNWKGSLDHLLATMSCRMSVMFGDALSQMEMEKLVQDLQTLPFEYCPHGRPVTVEVSNGELEKMFKRVK